MFKLPKNKWLWPVVGVWALLIISGSKILDNLFWDNFVKKLSANGITEEEMTSGFFHVSVPLLIIAVGGWIIYYCFKKAVDVQVSKKLAESKEFIVSPQMKTLAKVVETFSPQLNSSLKDSRAEWKAMRDAEIEVQKIQTDIRKNMELDIKEEKETLKTQQEAFDHYLDNQIQYLEKIKKEDDPYFDKILKFKLKSAEGFRTAMGRKGEDLINQLFTDTALNGPIRLSALTPKSREHLIESFISTFRQLKTNMGSSRFIRTFQITDLKKFYFK